MEDGFADPAPIVPRLQETVPRIIRKTGADMVIPGEVPNNRLLAISKVNRVDGMPLIDSSACTMDMAELTVDLRRATEIACTRQRWLHAVLSECGWL